MTFPTGQSISTANVASADSDPSLARSDIYDLIVLVNQLVASVNSAQGVLALDGSGKVSSTYLPGTYSTSSGAITLQPNSGVVNINKVLRLSQITTSTLGSATGTTSPSPGDLCFLADGDAGSPCLACYDGTSWKVVRLMTAVGDVGAALTATATLEAEAD